MSRFQNSVAAILTVALFACASSAARAALVTKYEYDSVNYLPSSQGWSGPSGLITLSNNTTDNALTVTDASTDVGAVISSNFAPADYSGPWTITATLRSDSASGIGETYFGVAMAGNYWNIWVSGTGDGGIYTVDSTYGPVIRPMATVPTSNTAFHTYKLVGNGGTSAPELWIDGVQTGQFAGDGFGSGGTSLVFGTWSSSGTSVSNWQLVRFDTGYLGVPEPASAALLSLGGLLLVRKRR